MRLLVCHPGASFSTKDVYDGLVPALRALGHEVVQYDLEGRLRFCDRFLTDLWRSQARPAEMDKPTGQDVIYFASQGILERALRFQPDWTLILTGMFVHPDYLMYMQRAGLRVGLVCTESPYDDEAQARVLPFVRVAWTQERASVPYLRQHNPEVHYLPPAYDASRHRPDLPIDETAPAHDVVFVGSGFRERVELLAAVDWSGIDLGLYGSWGKAAYLSSLRPYVRGGVVPNERATALYRRARIGLNLFRTERAEGAESLNPRMLELAATGCFIISNDRKEVQEVFGSLVPTFGTPAELGELVRRYLRADWVRRDMAAQLPAAVEGHTFAERARLISETLARLSDPVGVN